VAASEPERAAAAGARVLRVGPVVLALPAAVGLLAVFVAPIVVFAVYSLLTSSLYEVEQPFTLDSYVKAFESEGTRTLARNSVVIGLLAAVSTVAIALPIAFWLRYVARRSRFAVLFLITASMFASYLVRIFAWRTILGENGALNSALDRIGLIDGPLEFLLYSRFSVTIALVHIYLPYVVLVLYAGLGPVSAGLLEAAQDLGANAVGRWRRVVLPLVAAPATSAFLFVFTLSAADYVTPILLGGTEGVMLGVQIQAAFVATGDYAFGAALSFLMLLAFVALFALTSLGLRLARLDRIRFST